MTLQGPDSFTCALCGTTSAQMVIYSTHAFGHPDLDLRPPQGKRGTMPYWLQECPECGYPAYDLSKAEEKVKIRKVMEGDAWKDLMPKRHPGPRNGAAASKPKGQSHHPDFESVKEIVARSWGSRLAKRFLRRALIEVALGDPAAAAQSALSAAWADDDLAQGAQTISSQQRAASSRLWAAELFKQALNDAELDTERAGTIRVILIDVLRRARQWDEALILCRESKANNLNDVIAAVGRFQERLIEVRDDSCHTVADALGSSGPGPGAGDAGV